MEEKQCDWCWYVTWQYGGYSSLCYVQISLIFIKYRAFFFNGREVNSNSNRVAYILRQYTMWRFSSVDSLKVLRRDVARQQSHPVEETHCNSLLKVGIQLPLYRNVSQAKVVISIGIHTIWNFVWGWKIKFKLVTLVAHKWFSLSLYEGILKCPNQYSFWKFTLILFIYRPTCIILCVILPKTN